MPADVDDKLRIQGFLRTVGPQCTRYRAPAARHLVHADEMARACWCFFLPCPEVRHPACSAHNTAAKEAEKRQGRYRDVLSKLIATCSTTRLRDIRDRAILMVAFGSGGRRRSEVAGLRIEQLQPEDPIQIDGALPCSLFPFTRSYEDQRRRQ